MGPLIHILDSVARLPATGWHILFSFPAAACPLIDMLGQLSVRFLQDAFSDLHSLGCFPSAEGGPWLLLFP